MCYSFRSIFRFSKISLEIQSRFGLEKVVFGIAWVWMDFEKETVRTETHL